MCGPLMSPPCACLDYALYIACCSYGWPICSIFNLHYKWSMAKACLTRNANVYLYPAWRMWWMSWLFLIDCLILCYFDEYLHVMRSCCIALNSFHCREKRRRREVWYRSNCVRFQVLRLRDFCFDSKLLELFNIQAYISSIWILTVITYWITSRSRKRLHRKRHGVHQLCRTSKAPSSSIPLWLRPLGILQMLLFWLPRHPLCTFQSTILSRMRHYWHHRLHFWQCCCGIPEL